MRIFSALYSRVLRWSEHRWAPHYLALLSFAESSVFPIPPDVMLVPMALSKPERAWWYAGIATLFSVLGGLVGYALGVFFFHLLEPQLHALGYWAAFQTVVGWFKTHGIWVMFLAGFSPIPYKLFTLGAGTVRMPLLPFLVASLIGRAARFYVVAALMYWGGARMQNVLRRYIDVMGWVVVILAITIYLIWRLT